MSEGTGNRFLGANVSKSKDYDFEDEIRSSADLIFAIDSFSNLIDYNQDDQNINLDTPEEENDSENIIEKATDIDDCYTHTILLIGQCVVMCRDKIVELCG